MPHIDRSHRSAPLQQPRPGLARPRRQAPADRNAGRRHGPVRGAGARGDDTYIARFELLEATRRDVKARIAELQDTLAVLDHKISFYADTGRALASERSR